MRLGWSGTSWMWLVVFVFLAVPAAAEEDPLAPPAAEEGAPRAPGSAPADEGKRPEPKGPAAPAQAPESGKETTPEKPALPKVQQDLAKGTKDAGGDWGTPDTSPTKAVSADLLPPPVIRDPARPGSRTTAAGSPGGVSETPPLGGMALPPAGAGLLPETYDPALVPGPPPASPGTATAAPRAPAPAGGRIQRVTKVHNVKLGDGQAALRLDVEFGASGQVGRSLRLAAGFARADTGVRIRSIQPAFAGQGGALVARTAPVRVQANGRFRASLWVPYGSFPAPEAGGSYGVRGLVQLLRVEPDGRETVLSHDTVTFTVNGPAR